MKPHLVESAGCGGVRFKIAAGVPIWTLQIGGVSGPYEIPLSLKGNQLKETVAPTNTRNQWRQHCIELRPQLHINDVYDFDPAVRVLGPGCPASSGVPSQRCTVTPKKGVCHHAIIASPTRTTGYWVPYLLAWLVVNFPGIAVAVSPRTRAGAIGYLTTAIVVSIGIAWFFFSMDYYGFSPD